MSVLMLVVAGGTLVVSGALFASPLWSEGRALWLGGALLLGMGVTSLSFYASVLVADGWWPVVALLDGVVMGAAVAFWWRQRSAVPAGAEGGAPSPRLALVLGGGLLVIVVVAVLAMFVSISIKAPYGDWDAWATWNLRAKTLTTPEWRNAFVPNVGGHPDYPLGLPATIARLWVYGQTQTTLIPTLIAGLHLLALGLVLAGGLAQRAWFAVAVGVLVTFAPYTLVRWSAAQYADVPLAAWMLLAMVVFDRAQAADGERGGMLWGLFGLATAMTAWIKNEGITFALFVVILVGVVGWARRAPWLTRKTLLAVAIGALPVVVALLVHKGVFSPANDIVAAQGSGSTFAKLMDSGRYLVVAEFWGQTALRLFGLPLLGLVGYRVFAGWRPATQGRTTLLVGGIVIVLQMGVYFAVYIVTPLELNFHLVTSVDRLMVHVWPLLVWLTVSGVGEYGH